MLADEPVEATDVVRATSCTDRDAVMAVSQAMIADFETYASDASTAHTAGNRDETWEHTQVHSHTSHP